MNSNDIFKLLDCVGRATARKLPEIVEPLPVCGKTLSNALSAVRQGGRRKRYHQRLYFKVSGRQCLEG